jgi:hypothetical protein
VVKIEKAKDRGKKEEEISRPLTRVVKQAENRPIHYCFNFAFNIRI